MLPKPKPRRLIKAARRRAAARVVADVRGRVVVRDGHCRLALAAWMLGPCDGPSEWMHLGDMRRFKTAGQAPETRHTTAGTAMGCRRHHKMYDRRVFDLSPLTDAGADGTLRVKMNNDPDSRENSYGVGRSVVV